MQNQVLEIDDSANRVLLVDQLSAASSSSSAKSIQLVGYSVEKISKLSMAPAVVEASAPDLLLLSVDSLELLDLSPLNEIQYRFPIPIVVFAQTHSVSSVKVALASGVSSYIVDDVSPDRLPVIFDVASERFQQQQSVKAELAQVIQKLDDRKLIERAKGAIMKHKNLSEDQAYKEMRNAAMNQGKSMAMLSKRIISIFEETLI